jgi:ABC-type uncharacterized transport system substrate-binding protein
MKELRVFQWFQMFQPFQSFQKHRSKNIIGLALGALLLAPCFPIGAQQPGKVYRIGYLSNAAGRDTEEVFRQTLRDLGYIEGQNLRIEWRFSKGNLNLLPALATELVGLKPDCIVAFGVAPTRAAKNATETIPIHHGQRR